MTVQQIGKLLNANGYKKASTKRVNFQTINVGHYELKLFKHEDLYAFIHLRNGVNPDGIMRVLKVNGLDVEFDRGYIKIFSK